MSELKKYCLRIDVDQTTGASTLAFVCGQSETSGHQSAVSLESTPRVLTSADLSGTLQEFLTTHQHLLEAKL